MPTLSAAQEAALNLGLLVMGGASLLAVAWLGLQIIAWFKPKEIYATVEQLRELEARVVGFGAKLDTMSTTMQNGFNDLQRSIGRLEGHGHG